MSCCRPCRSASCLSRSIWPRWSACPGPPHRPRTPWRPPLQTSGARPGFVPPRGPRGCCRAAPCRPPRPRSQPTLALRHRDRGGARSDGPVSRSGGRRLCGQPRPERARRGLPPCCSAMRRSRRLPLPLRPRSAASPHARLATDRHRDPIGPGQSLAARRLPRPQPHRGHVSWSPCRLAPPCFAAGRTRPREAGRPWHRWRTPSTSGFVAGPGALTCRRCQIPAAPLRMRPGRAGRPPHARRLRAIPERRAALFDGQLPPRPGGGLLPPPRSRPARSWRSSSTSWHRQPMTSRRSSAASPSSGLSRRRRSSGWRTTSLPGGCRGSWPARHASGGSTCHENQAHDR